MQKRRPWLFTIDNNMWKVYLNDTYELVYKIMSEDKKWSEEKIIDREVMEFTISIEDGIIHILYVNKDYKMRYCTRNDNNWFGEELYDTRINKFEIQELKTIILEGKMHLFYLMAAVDGTQRGILEHCIWNGKEIKLNTVQHIVLSDKVYKYYELQIEKENCIDIFFVSNRGDELSLNYCVYDGVSWTDPKRLYGIQGDNIMFRLLNTPYEFNIINKIKEGNIYSIEYVRIEDDVNMKEYTVYSGIEEPIEPIIFYIDNNLFISWFEQNHIYSSRYKLGKWEKIVKFNKEVETPIEAYNFLSVEKKNTVDIIYGTEDDGLYIFYFENLAKSSIDMSSNNKLNNNFDINNDDDSIEEIKEKFKGICYENSVLKEKIDSFSIHMRKRKLIAQEYEDKIARMIQEKKRLKENCNFFMEVKQKIQKELDEVKKQLKKQRIFINNMKSSLNKKDKDNKMLEEEVNSLMEENSKLKGELEFERNQSFMSKLFRKKE